MHYYLPKIIFNKKTSTNMWVKDNTVTSGQYDSLLKRITQQIKISFWTDVSLSLSIQERTELRLKYSFFLKNFNVKLQIGSCINYIRKLQDTRKSKTNRTRSFKNCHVLTALPFQELLSAFLQVEDADCAIPRRFIFSCQYQSKFIELI